jgi:hypothetical protein
VERDTVGSRADAESDAAVALDGAHHHLPLTWVLTRAPWRPGVRAGVPAVVLAIGFGAIVLIGIYLVLWSLMSHMSGLN